MARTKQTARRGFKEKKRTALYAKRKKTDEKDIPIPGVKKPRRYKPGVVALREIRRQQLSVKNVIPRAPFERLVREVLNEFKIGTRLAQNAVHALQEACETLLIELMEHTNLCCIHGKRVGIQPKDMKLALLLSKPVLYSSVYAKTS